jgi:hypothetical protein
LEDGIAATKRLHIANDIPFPFERAMPPVTHQPAPAPAPPVVSSAEAAGAEESAEPVHESAAAPQAEASHQ